MQDPERHHPSERAVDAAFDLVYRELRAIAERHMSRERPNHTLRPTALVSEAYLKLRGQSAFAWKDEAHFLAMASQAMRQVLIDLGRKRHAARRQGQRVDVDLALIEDTGEIAPEDFLAVHGALSKLASQPPNGSRQAKLVEWVWLTGMNFSEAAEQLGISRRQAHRDWAWARAWLARELADG